MSQKNYCDICGEELSYDYWKLDASVDEDVKESFDLCDYHYSKLKQFMKILKKDIKKEIKSKS